MKMNSLHGADFLQCEHLLGWSRIVLLSWNPIVNYQSNKYPALDSVPSQINSVHALPPSSLRSILILPSHLPLELPIGFLVTIYTETLRRPANHLYLASTWSALSYFHMPFSNMRINTVYSLQLQCVFIKLHWIWVKFTFKYFIA